MRKALILLALCLTSSVALSVPSWAIDPPVFWPACDRICCLPGVSPEANCSDQGYATQCGAYSPWNC